ncbi:MAG: hypothetical protein LC754_05105 [Acidobacteria bacterium]|nr:hypothetical protein [Acidobacteriota bacterium]
MSVKSIIPRRLSFLLLAVCALAIVVLQHPSAAQQATRQGEVDWIFVRVEDVRGLPNPTSIPSNVSLIPNSRPYIFFVSLGQEHDQQLENFVKDPALEGRGEVVRDPGAENIAGLADRIREPIEEAAAAAPTPVPTPTLISITSEPLNLDFGQLEPGAETNRQTLNIRSNTATAVQLTLEGLARNSGISLVEPSGPVALKADESVSVKVRLAAAPDAADGTRTFILKVNPRDDAGQPPTDAVVKAAWAEGRVNVAHIPLWRKWLKWLALLLLLLLVAVVLYSLYKGETPFALWGGLRQRNYLEGELEVLRPTTAQSEDGFISLGKLETKHVALSALVPDGATAADDAELTAIHRNGVKLMQLRRTQGAVRVNEAEVAFTDLYDSDIIELGDARLRFNWLGHERPSEPEENIS